MTAIQHIQQELTRGFILLATAMTLAACAGSLGLSSGWTEEAIQPDGQKILVERKVAHKGRHEFGQRPPIGYQSLSFTVPGSGERITWEDTYSEDIGGSNFIPLLVGTREKKAYVLAEPAGALSCNKWNRPNPPYVAFEYKEDKTWVRIPLREFPVEFTKPNLIISSPDVKVENAGKRHMTADMIADMNETTLRFNPHFQTIVREPYAKGERCAEMVYDGKGGWIGIDWFTDQPSRAACLGYCDRKKISPQYCPCENIFKGELR
jgi:hypothetical protein